METDDPALTIGAVIGRLRRQFDQHGVPDPMHDARMLTGGLVGLDLTAMVVNPDRLVTDDENDLITTAALRRCRGEPVFRILGTRAFYGLDIQLSSATLEPRPDTELVVETALPLAQTAALTGTCRILDLGTGSGAICLALLAAIGTATAVATDISPQALQTAQNNANRLGLADRFQAVESDWFDNVQDAFDLIVSNPPYIRSAEISLLDPEVRNHDPLGALDGGVDGLNAYRAIASKLASHLKSPGHLVLETGFDQHDSVISLFETSGFACLDRVRDLGGNDRVLVFSRNRAAI